LLCHANVNAVSIPEGETPLQKACYAGNVTNLDFVEFLLEVGADPNTQDHLGLTPLMFASPLAPGRCSQIPAELAYHGRQYYHSIWSILSGQGSLHSQECFRQYCTP
jgi:hypothetical protein